MSTITPQAGAPPDHVRVLADRLDRGWNLINTEPDPARRSKLEDHWIALLRDYEAACDQAIVGDAEVAA